MRYRMLGTHGPEISLVGYGAWEIGGQFYGPNPSEGEVVPAIHAALDAGMNWIDTAEVYGDGTSEALVGRAIRGLRDEVLVFTKVAPGPSGTGFEPAQVRRAIRGSLKRLGTDHVDLYQLHWFPHEEPCPIEETWGAMRGLVDEGLVRWAGVSNFSVEQIERCLAVGPVDSLQPELSMLHRDEEATIAWCGESRIGVIAYGPLAYGLLTGAITAQTRFHPGDFRSGNDPGFSYYRELFAPGRIERHLEVVDRLRPLAAGLEATVAQLALAWAFHRPGVTAAIAGSRSPKHNRENAGAGDLQIPAEVLEEIEEILAPVSPSPSSSSSPPPAGGA